MSWLYRILLSLLFCTSLHAETLITLQGYVSKEVTSKAIEQVQKADFTSNPDLIIEINSTKGDLEQTLELAKTIYEIKQQKPQLKVIVYIQENALGPTAILPFLADELYISLLVSWGDIPLGNEDVIPVNILRNRVVSLISSKNPKESLLKAMAAAMIDPNAENKNLSITNKGELLVVNQHQLLELGLVSTTTSLEKFQEKFQLSKEQNIRAQTVETSLKITPEDIMERLKNHIKLDPNGKNNVGHITINDRDNGINQSTYIYVKNALDYYKQNKPAFIILELNTPGGEVFAAQRISDALKDMDTQYNVPVVAFINNWAISAGAMLAYSCRFIMPVKDGSMGAAEPVTVEGQKMETASEKVNSALRADFANRARFFDRNPYIAEAMVDKDIILVLRNGSIIKLDNENQIKTTGLNKDIIISPKGKLLTLDAKQMVEYGVADMVLLPEKLEPITEQEKSTGKWPASKQLIFKQPFFKDIPNAIVDTYQMDWKTRFFVFLANPIVSSVLFLGLLLGIYMEINTPGFGLAATVALTCLFFIILSSFALEAAGWLELIFLLTGLVVLALELFVLPTFGLLGFIGVILFLAGLFGLMIPGIGSISFEYDTKTLNAAGEFFFKRLAWLLGTMMLGFAIIGILGRYFLPRFSAFNRFVLAGKEQDASEGYTSAGNDVVPQPGVRGIAATTLRPAGKIMIGEQLYDAVSDGSFIEKNADIVVLRVEGNRIIVNQVEST